ncbi:MAG: amino acid adenylation domain-containing protein [Pseudomonadales bacterium]
MADLSSNFLTHILAAPDAAVALRYQDRALTYAELRNAAWAVADELSAAPFAPGSRIGICMERGLLAPVSLLGCLLAGHTYVPLDPGYPVERLHNMMQIAELATLLCDQATTKLISHPQGITLDIDVLLSASVGDLTKRRIAPASLAYIIFTSGSTGLPKAVSMPNEALATLLRWQSSDARFAESAKVLQFTPISFDVHFQELFHTWARHGEVCVVDDAERRDPLALLHRIDEWAIERLYLPFVALAQLTESAVANQLFPQSLRDVVTAGEQLVVTSKVRTFFGAISGLRLHNQYGPSETHVVTAYTLAGEVASWPELPPIGYPIEGADLQVCSEQGTPVAPGQPGELYIGGSCLAAGYFGAPALTNERFVATDAGRAYRSGDLVQCDSDGCYHYLGRSDQQLKIRGHRVEPGEVEAAIAADEAVATCAVAGRKVSADELALMAYVVLQPQLSQRDEDTEAAALATWQAVWDGTYATDLEDAAPEFDLRGWNSSFTGKQLASADMRHWVDQTRQRILSAANKNPRVLELGCGTGLFVFAMAEQCREYVATDYSPVTIKQLQERLQSRPGIGQNVAAQVLKADQAHTLGAAQFDVVVVNSLTQHFVSYQYLLQVVASALQTLRPGGCLFFGDITSKTTRSLYYTAVEDHKLGADASVSELLNSVSARQCSERELVIEPWLFLRMAELFPDICQARIQLKGGGYDNELADYRYDVTLTKSAGAMAQAQPTPQVGTQAPAAPLVRDWSEFEGQQAVLEWLREQLAGQPLAGCMVTGIPNARVAHPAALLRLARAQTSADSAVSLAELRQQAAASVRSEPGVDPEIFHALGQGAERAAVQTFHGASEALFDVVLGPASDALWTTAFATRSQQSLPGKPFDRALDTLISHPIDVAAFALVEERLRARLGAVLPEYLLPSRYIALSEMPLTPSGKLDRQRLPAPATTRPALAEAFVAPAPGLQEQIATLWRSRLLLDQVGVNDNFFDLGGSSLQSLKICAEMSESLAVPVPVVALFQFPTVASLARHLEQAQAGGIQPTPARAAQRRSNSGRQQQAVAAHRARLRQRKQ